MKLTDEQFGWLVRNRFAPYKTLARQFKERFGLEVDPNNLRQTLYRYGIPKRGATPPIMRKASTT